MKPTIEYKVVIANNKDDFQRELNDLTKQGWIIASNYTVTENSGYLFHSVIMSKTTNP